MGKTVTILGAGIVGLWQAYMFAKRGHIVHVIEKDETPFASAASRYAGAMLAPYCEEEGANALIRELGLRALELWFEHDASISQNGSLVLALPRERKDLKRFARMTQKHVMVASDDLQKLEPDLSDTFETALYFPDEAHLNPHLAMEKLLQDSRQLGVTFSFGSTFSNETETFHDTQSDWTIDCRGLAARDALPSLRAVRGERVIVRAPEVTFKRPLRLLHTRFPIYIVPWHNNTYMIGATVIESDDPSGMTVKSALELLSAAYALQSAFAKAEILDFGAGLRPAFSDNIPKIVTQGQTLYVNGMYRHGFLLAPVLAEMTCDYIENGQKHPEICIEDYFER